MRTIIILVIVNFIILKLFGINILKHLLFNPKINASITILAIILYIIEFARAILVAAANPSLTRTVILLIGLIIVWIISILDCIQDIRRGEDYYGQVEDRISPLYAVKCITSMFTSGLSRAAFFLFTSLCIPRIAMADVKSAFEGKLPTEVNPQYPYGSSFVANFFGRRYSIEFLRFSDPYITDAALYVMENLFMEWKAVRYDSEIFKPSYGCPYTDYEFVGKYCEKYKLLKPEIENRIRRNLAEGRFLTNEKCVDEEIRLRKDNLEKAYPQKILVKAIERFTAEGKQALKEREKAERELSSKESLYTYIDINYYYDCGQIISEAMSNRGELSACDIISIDELAFLTDLQEKDSGCDQRWKEYFVIFIMQWLVSEGIINDDRISNAILDTHQYSHVKGNPRLQTYGNNDPRLVLDDD